MSTQETTALSGDEAVDQVMRTWPDTIRIFLDHRLMCVGCPVGPFHTVAEACAEHDVPVELFLQDLNGAISRAAPT